MKNFLILCFGFLILGCSPEPKSTEKIESSLDLTKLPSEISQYGRLVGEWNCQIQNLKDSVWVQDSAYWEFRYVLGGSAVQDFWKNPSSTDTTTVLLGTNIRIYNPNEGLWKCVWLENQSNSISGIWDSYQNEEGAMILHDGTGNWEIAFFNIEDNRFDWKWDFKQPDGSMKTMMKMQAYKIEEASFSEIF